ASRTLWVTKRIVSPFSRQIRSNSSWRMSRVMASSAPKGSSMSRTSASWARARARATRCRMPPESSWGRLRSKPVRRTRSRSSITRRLRSALGTRLTFMGTSMLAPTVSHGKSDASWNIIATRRVPTSTAPSEGSSRPATRESSVLLPQPEAPTIARNSPVPTATLIPSMAVTAPLPPPKTLVTSVISMASVLVGVWVAMVMEQLPFQPGHRLVAVLGEDRVERVEGVDSGQVDGVEQPDGRGPLRSGEQRGCDRVDREGDVVEGGGGQLRTESSPGDLLQVVVGDHLCLFRVVV